MKKKKVDSSSFSFFFFFVKNKNKQRKFFLANFQLIGAHILVAIQILSLDGGKMTSYHVYCVFGHNQG